MSIGAAIITVIFYWPAVSIVLAADGLGIGDWEGTESRNSNGVIHMHSPETPMLEDREGELRISWRRMIDPQDEVAASDPAAQGMPPIGIISSVVEGDDGRIYALDLQMKHILVFTAKGEYLRVMGGPGGGPGETDHPICLLNLTGGRIGIAQSMPGKIIVFDGEGAPRDTYRVIMSGPGETGFVTIQRIQSLQRGMVIAGSALNVIGSERKSCAFISVMDSRGCEIRRVMERKTDFARLASGEGLIELADVSQAIWASGERLYLVDKANEYCISVYGGDGLCQRMLSRKYQQRKYTEEEKTRIGESYEAMSKKIPLAAGLLKEVPEYGPCIVRLIPRPDGKLWVQPNDAAYGVRQNGSLRYDVFDQLGRYECRIELRAEDILLGDQLYFLKDCIIAVRGMAARQAAMLNIPEFNTDQSDTEVSIARYEIAS